MKTSCQTLCQKTTAGDIKTDKKITYYKHTSKEESEEKENHRRLVMKRHGKQSRRMTMDYWKHLSQILFIMLRENVNWKENRVLD
ncbi:hypothetical protein ACS0PU_007397 [Formica fusca]